MKFYLGNRSNEVKVLVRPQLTNTKDESLSSMSVVLDVKGTYGQQATPIAPKTNFILDMETNPNTVFCFVVESDVVSVFSNSPRLYKHTLTLVEKRKILQSYLVRNSSFTTNPNPNVSMFSAVSYLKSNDGEYDPQTQNTYSTFKSLGDSWTHPTQTTIVDNVKGNAYVKLNASFFYIKDNGGVEYDQPDTLTSRDRVIGEGNNFNTLEDVNDKFEDYFKDGDKFFLSYANNIYLDYIDSSNTHRYLAMDFEDLGFESNVTEDIVFNQRVLSPVITSVLNNGGHNLKLVVAKDVVHQPYTLFNLGRLLGPMAFTIAFEVEIEAASKSCYDVLDLLRKRQLKKNSKNSNPISVFNLPDMDHYVDTYLLLKETPAPNFTFTQATLFECIAEVFRVFDATFTMDEDNYINIDYLNEKKTQVNLDGQLVGVTQTLGSERYENGIVAHYQDARTIETFPSNKTYSRVRSMTLGVPSQSDHFLIVPHKIDSIKKLYMYLPSIRILMAWGGMIDFTYDVGVDISRWCVEDSIWSQLSTSSTYPINNDFSAVAQNNSVSYAKNDNKISIAKTYNDTSNQTRFTLTYAIKSAIYTEFGLTSPSNTTELVPLIAVEHWEDYLFKIEYFTSVDGKTRVESLAAKHNGEFLIDQNSGGVDLDRMGLNMLGVAMKSGEPDKTVTLKLRNWADRIEEGSYTSDGYVANNVIYTFLANGQIQERIQFVKNFNALSQRIRLMKEKRLSNISNELTTKSEEIIMEYCIVQSEMYADDTNSLTGIFSSDKLAKMLANTFNVINLDDTVTIGYATFNNSKAYTEIFDVDNEIYLPLIKYGAGNCVCLEMSYDSPISAGNMTRKEQSGWWSGQRFFTQASPYTDKNGETEKCTIYFYGNQKKTFTQNFPNACESSDNYGSLVNLELYKQPNEIFALNYELCFLTGYDDEFIGNNFITKNGIVEIDRTKTFYFYYSVSAENNYDVLDKKANTDTKTRITSVLISHDGTNDQKFYLEFHFKNQLPSHGRITSWCIGDENKNIYFASNRHIVILQGTPRSYKRLYFTYTGQKRL